MIPNSLPEFINVFQFSNSASYPSSPSLLNSTTSVSRKHEGYSLSSSAGDVLIPNRPRCTTCLERIDTHCCWTANGRCCDYDATYSGGRCNKNYYCDP